MLKKFTFKRIGITTLLLLLALLLYNYPEAINEEYVPKKRNYINIYLIDENDFVSMTEMESEKKEDEERIATILDALIIGNETDKLPSGFKAIIPENTKVLDFHLEDGLLKVNFSKEFLNVSLEDEEKMIEAIVFSLTTIHDVQKIMLFVEGERLLELPNSHKRLDLYLDRSYGINKVIDIQTFHDTSMVTVYYLNSINNSYYYIPISYISNDDADKIEIIISSLKTNRLHNSNLSSHLNYQVELMNYEATSEEVRLDFNEVLLDSVYEGKLQEEIKYAVSYSICDTLGIETVVFQVNNNKIDEFRLAN